MSKIVQENYDRMSRWYDLFASSEMKFTLAGVNLLNVQPGESALEIGCGTGHALGWLKKAAGPGLIIGMDLSAGMLHQAQKNLSSAEIPLLQSDALSLPCRFASFDVAFLSFTLELFPTSEIPLVLSECRRVLKPDGRLGLVSMAEGESAMVKLYKWGHHHWPEILDCRPISTLAYLNESGFEILKTDRQTMWGLPVDLIIVRPTT